MKKLIFTFVFLASAFLLFAQDKQDLVISRPRNSVYFGLLGDASLLSIHYERLLLSLPDFLLIGKCGLGINEEFQIFGGSTKTFWTIPHHLTGNFGKEKHFFEIGLGGTIINGDTNQHYLLYPIIGYRLLSTTKNLNLRIFASYPFSGMETDVIVFFPVGFCVGMNL